MLTRTPHPTTEQEQRRARRRRSLKEHRDRVRRGLAIYLVAVDAATIDLLVHRRYLTDSQAIDKALVNRALSQLLWDLSHGR